MCTVFKKGYGGFLLFELSLKVLFKGWAEATLSDGKKDVKIFASRLSDGLWELIITVWKIIEVENNAICSWQEEPGNYRWLFSRDGDQLKLRILWFEKAFCQLPDEKGKEVFVVSDDVVKMIRTIIRAYDKLLYEIGEKEYKENWTYDFPKVELERLRAAFQKLK